MIGNKSFLVVILQLIQTVISAVTVIYLARLLETQEYGKYVYYSTAASILPLFAGLGGEHVFLMEGSKESKLIPFFFGNAILIRTVLTIILIGIVILILFIFHISEFYAIFFIVLGSLLSAFSNPLFLSFYRIIGIYIRPWIICFLAPLFLIIFIFSIPQKQMSFQTVSLGYFLSQCLPLCVFLYDIKTKVRLKISVRYIKKFLQTGVVFSISQMFDYAFARLDIFLIQLVSGSYAVGIYAAGQRVVSLLQLIPSSFHVVELPEFHRVSNNKLLLTEKFRKLRLILVELGLLFFGLLIVNSTQIISILFTPQYKDSFKIIILLSVAGFLLFINYPYYMLAEAINKINERMIRRIYTFLLTAFFIYIFLIYFGINGAAIGLILGQLVFLCLLHQITDEANGGFVILLYDIRSIVVAIIALLGSYTIGLLLPLCFLQAILISLVYVILFIGLGTYFKLLNSLDFIIRQLLILKK